jgi:tetratricopeptide (TPR) repeat protein
MSNPQAESEKEKGNEAIKKKDFVLAAQHYTNAINFDGSQSTYYSNRALAYINTSKYEEAFQDSEKAIELAPTVARVCRLIFLVNWIAYL